MNGNTYGKLLLSGVSFSSLSVMSYLIYEDTKRQNKDNFIYNEGTSNIVEGTTYVSPYHRCYGSTYVKPKTVNEKVLPAINYIFDNNCMVPVKDVNSTRLDTDEEVTGRWWCDKQDITLTNLEENVYKDSKYDLVCFSNMISNHYINPEDKYNKYFE
tara:strand:- start:235 stop:705 length:471 start_codon:yes stop_codon:yes gene_type:complete